MLQTFFVIAPLFLIILGASVVQKFARVPHSWERVLNAFALNVGLPALIFAALSRTEVLFRDELDVVLLNSLFLVGSFVISYIISRVLRLHKQARRTLFICFAFGNIAYLGIPTLVAISGEAVLSRVSLIVAVHLLWIFTIGIGYLAYTQGRKHQHVFRDVTKLLFTNSLLLSVVAGILVAIYALPIPVIVMASIDMLAASVTPVVLVVIGLFIGNSSFGRVREWGPVFLFVLVTLFLLPMLLFQGLRLFGYNPDLYTATILEAAMPLAITPFALSDKYNLNKHFIARAIVLSTILSIVTIPFWASII